MEEFKVFGKQTLNFKNREGEDIKGVSLHCTTSSLPNSSWEGLAYEKLWCPVGSQVNVAALAVPVGSTVQVEFDRKGKPVSLAVKK